MAKKSKREQKPQESLGERIHDRIVAAEVAAEEAAEFGWSTTALEAAEAAADPDREAGEGDDSGKESPGSSA